MFEHLGDAGLKLKPNKCHSARSEIRYRGHIVSRDGVKADPEKLRAITSYPTPRDVKEVVPAVKVYVWQTFYPLHRSQPFELSSWT